MTPERAEALLEMAKKRVDVLRSIAKRDVVSTAITIDEEVYVFFYTNTEKNQRQLRKIFRKFAKNPKLNFTWGEAASLDVRLKELEEKRRFFLNKNRFTLPPPKGHVWDDNLQ